MSPQTFILIGRSGCGKGTQAELLIEYLKKNSPNPVFYLESGQKFREFISSSGYTASLSNEIMKTGELQPPFLAIHIWSHLMIEQMDEQKHLIIDGTPRKLEEAMVLDGALQFYKRKNVYILHVNVSRKWSIDRLIGRGRADDKSIDEINKRLDWFDTDVIPVIDYLRGQTLAPKPNGGGPVPTLHYKYIDINGEQTIPEVHEEIIKKIL